MPVIYIDVLFLINFVLDSGLLLITGRLSGKFPNPLRTIMGGIMGGIYACGIFFVNLPVWSSFIVKIITSSAMIFAVFFPFSIKEFFKLSAAFYLQTFLLGGALSATFYFSGRPAVMSNNIYYFPFSTLQLLCVSLPLIATLYYYWKKSKNRLLSYGKYCNITIKYNDKTLCAEGLVDSGCSLYDPLSGKPVIILSASLSDKFFDEKLVGLIKTSELATLLIEGKFRLIPYSTISELHGNMPAFLPDTCSLKFDKKEFLCDCVIAFSHSYTGEKAIINPDALVHHKNFGGKSYEL